MLLCVHFLFDVAKSVNQNKLDFLAGSSSWNRKMASVLRAMGCEQCVSMCHLMQS